LGNALWELFGTMDRVAHTGSESLCFIDFIDDIVRRANMAFILRQTHEDT
jgi:hypothetical protein